MNAIAPGPFKTNLGGGGPISAAAKDMWKAVVPLGRMGDPAEIRGLALLLACNACSFMTGGVYPIDGGALLQGPSLPPSANPNSGHLITWLPVLLQLTRVTQEPQGRATAPP